MSASTPTIPSRNPGDDTHLAGVLKTALRKTLEGLQGQLPAIVIAYDRVKNVAQVQPLISVLMTNGHVVPRSDIASVPVLALGGGGFCINFPLRPGDIGWIRASDRDISLFKQSLQMAKPNTRILHSFDNGMFVPDAFNKYTFDSADDAANMVIQSYDGTVKISLTPNSINVIASAAVNVTAPQINLAASAETHFTGGSAVFDVPATFNKPVTITAGSTINAATIAGYNFSTHEHSNGNGGANTGGVVA